ncbi:MAG: NADH-quinone oxidoreductase subunit H [Candidatus Solibacter usitatus]|nr:NADH-quinone oxidoreductase subunit H [Candidatus Solibacter usitatus]
METFIIISLVKAGLVAFVLLTLAAYLVWIERKVLAHIQLRVGPYRVGPHGLLQPLSDLIKLVTKEGVIPANVNTFFYLLAPFIAVALSLISISVVPFGTQIDVLGVKTYMQLTDVNVGVLVILAISAVSVYAVALGGWASNNKYALLGGLRSSAQMISYELPMSLAIASPLLMANTLSLREIAESQAGFYFGFIPKWYIFQGPMPQMIAFLIFLIAAFAETNRVPFDLPEAENELVAGFHTEYSSTCFAAFFTAEYVNMVTISALGTHLFLGGWNPVFPEPIASFVPVLVHAGAGLILLYHGTQTVSTRTWDRYTFPLFGLVALGVAGVFSLPLLPVPEPLLSIGKALHPIFWFGAKVGSILFLFIWIRGTLPRFRFDQLMRFAWLFLFPLSVLHLLVTGLLVALN